ncbi:MAG: DUF1553 domain-containing protein [Verrucomicrobia bacterium]|nr:DUF1553 domain-containing protein [Verrucomicrobiota bacterium]
MTKILSLFLLALCVFPASAKTLTEKQARDAAARIDSLLAADLKTANIRANGRISDSTFLRRAYLGIIGRIPSEEEASAFLENASRDKRANLVDFLTASPGFDSHLFNWTADLLRVQTKQEQFGLGWHVWLRKSLSEDKPWDTIVNEMLSSTGHAAKDPAVGYYLRDRNMQLDNFSNSMQVFLGRQIGCAQCHDHPFDDWSQLEYFQMAAFGGGFTYHSDDAQKTIRRVAMDLKPAAKASPNTKGMSKKKAMKARNKAKIANRGESRKIGKLLQPIFKDFNKNALIDDPSRSLRLPEDYQYRDADPKSVVSPETLFGEHLENVSPEERRVAFAKWVTSPENPFFTKVIANRLWARTFGHGLLEPIDDWSEDSKPAHPQILAFLETTMKAVDYDLRQFTRVLFHTDLFQRECDATEPVMGVAHIVRGPALQRMTAEQLYDSMLVLTRGNVDDSPRPSHSIKWEQYAASIERLLEAESHDLLVLGESATQAEDAFRKARAEVRRLQRELGGATSDSQRKKLQLAARAARKTLTKYAKLRDPLSMVKKEMMSMGKREERGGGTTRASEHPAPFNAGTLVREFGGSDRTTPSSGDTIPTVPQALALLNDPNTEISLGKRSVLSKRLLSIKSPEARLEAIFLRLYARPPSARETKTYAPLAKDASSLRDLTNAMLTSNQFIFVQ